MDFGPQRRKRVNHIKRELTAEMPIHELRRALVLVRQATAEHLDYGHPGVSEPDRTEGADLLRLQSWIESAGGRLKIVAEFPEGEVVITSFPGTEGCQRAGRGD